MSDNSKAGSSRQEYSWRQHLSVLLPLLLVYLTLAGYRIDYQSLWLDEILSLRDAPSLGKIWNKGHGPLYFAMLHVWMSLGTSEWVLRALSVILGGVALCLFYGTSLPLLGRRAAIVGTALFATSPFLIWYSQEVRYIILMLTTALLAMYTFQRLLTSESRLGWLAYGGAVLLALFSFVANVFVPLAQGLYLVWSPSHRTMLRNWLICQLLIGILFLGWAGNKFVRPLLMTTTVDGQETLSINPKSLQMGNRRAFDPVVIPYTFFAFSAGYSQGPSLRELHISQSFATLRAHLPSILSLGCLFGGLFLVGLVAIWRQPESGKLLTLWVVVPALGVLGVSTLTNLAYNARYMGMVFPAYVIILAMGVTCFRRPMVQGLLLALVLLSNGVSLANYYSNPRYMREDARSAVRYLESAVRSEDLVVVVGKPHALRYYAKGKLPITSVRNEQYLAEHLSGLSKDHQRLWLVGLRFWGTNLPGKVEAVLGDMYARVDQTQFPGVQIYRYQLAK